MKTRSNSMKRLLSLALCICMVLALVPAINLTTEAAAEKVTVYFKNNDKWSSVCIYYWGSESTPAWPGVKMTNIGTHNNTAYYSYEIPADVTGIIFNNGNNGIQTQNIEGGWYEGITYYYSSGGSVGTFNICADFSTKHIWKTVPGSAVTCIKDGVSDGEQCTICGKYKVAPTVVKAEGHKFGEDGICTVCQTGTMNIFFQNNWVWQDIKLYYWYDGVESIQWPGIPMEYFGKTPDDYGHEYDYYKLTVPADVSALIINGYDPNPEKEVHDQQTPDITADQLYNGVCFYMVWNDGNQVGSYNITLDFPCALGHAFGAVEYTWAEGDIACTASRICGNCGETETERVTSSVCEETAANCVAPAVLQFDVSFDADWAEAQSKQYVDPSAALNPDNHVDEKAVYVDNGDGTHDLEWLCCGAHVETAVAHFEGDVKNGYCDNCNVLLAPVQLMKTSASLEGNISVNYFMLLSEEVINDESAYIQFTVAGRDPIKVPVSQSQVIDGYHVFSCEVNAKEMTDIISMQFFYGGIAAFAEPHPYNVRTYAKHIMKNYDDEKTRNLMEAMVNYGAASQKYFGYDADNLANSIKDENGNALITPPDYDNVKIENFNVIRGQGTEKVKFYSASLILNSETTLRLFFNGPVSVTLQGEELEVKQRGSLYYADVVGISAKDLDEDVTVTINDGAEDANIRFNPMVYCQSIQDDTTGSYSTEMKNLACALYLYNKAANEYFDKEG